MRRLLAAITLLLTCVSLALAQTPPPTFPANTVYGRLGIGSGPGQAIPFTTLAQQLQLSNTVSVVGNGVTSCSTSTNATSAVMGLYNSGHYSIFMPGNCFYQAGGSGGGVYTDIPAKLTLIGDCTSSAQCSAVVKAVDRTNSGAPGSIYLEAGAQLINIGTQSYPGDQLTSPLATQKTVLLRQWVNNGATQQTGVPWQGSSQIILGATQISPEGAVSTDNPGIQLSQFSAGDAIYSTTSGSGVSFRINPVGSGDTGILIDDIESIGNVHTLAWLNVRSSNLNSYGLRLTRSGLSSTPSGAPLIVMDDTSFGGTARSSAWFNTSISYQGSGNIFSIFQGTTAFSGNFININAGNAAGTFSGKFIEFDIANVAQYLVDSGGNVFQQGTLRMGGSSSGSVTLQTQAAAGTPTVTWGTSSGTPVVTASSPLAITAATGNATCTTCVTSAASLTANQLVIGSGSQGEQTLGTLGTTTTVLHGNAAGAPTFAAVSLTADVSGILPGANGGTGVANTGLTLTLAGSLSLPAVVQGDLWYGSAAGTISALAKSTGTSNFLKNSGTSNNPAWARPACSDLSDAGTACPINTGTSGGTVPLQNSTFTFSSSLNNVLRYNLTNSSNGGSALNVLDFGNDAGSTQTEFVQAGSGNASFGAAGSFSVIHNAIFTFRPSNVEQIRINLSGGLSIGATTDPGAGGLYVNGATITLNGLATDATHTDRTVCQDTTSKSLFFGSGAAGICLGTSSARFKHDIVRLTAGLEQIVKLDAVAYKLNADHGDPDKLLYGFTAEQGAKALPDLVGRDETGQPQTFDYMGVVPVLVRAVQELKADNDNMREEIKMLQQRITP